MNEMQTFKMDFAGRPLVVETGKYAKQANGAVMVRYGDTVVLTAAVGSKEPSKMGFFPLTVNYEEKMYAVGKVPGSFQKREGRPSNEATLFARMIDRPIRPMFAEGYANEVQITNTILSVEQDCPPEIAAMFGSSLALGISDIPFKQPIAGVNIGYINGEYIINPTLDEREKSLIELTVAGTGDAINMVESGAQQMSEEVMLKGLQVGHDEIKKLTDFQEEIISQIGKEKFEVEIPELDAELKEEIYADYREEMSQAIQIYDKLERGEAIGEVKEKIIETYEEKSSGDIDEDQLAEQTKEVSEIVDEMEKDEVRRLITEEKIRPDGRKPDEIRSLASEAGLLPRAHGSALFTRGQTQTLSATTLAPLSEHQIIDGLGTEEIKRFMHHYNFPQYSVGSTGPARSPGRREIGHGALGERALLEVIPDEKDFPYTIRVVSEVLESNGSSSQASITSASLSLMDAGVPIKAPVGGIAMGLIMGENNEYTILTDIQGMEDHLGDMDFKVAGTREGITALQMDIKIDGITPEILSEALVQAKKARLEIIDNIEAVLAEPRPELSRYAPKIETMQINPDKIKVVIGKSGDTINEIIAQTDVKIDIEDDGQINIYGENPEMMAKARQMIEDLTAEVEVDKIYNAKIVRVEDYGVFAEVLKDQTGLVHVSQLSNDFIKNVRDDFKVGDFIDVKVNKIDERGRIDLSRKDAINEQNGKKEEE